MYNHMILLKFMQKESGEVVDFDVIVRFDSQVEIDYYRHGGILQMVLEINLLNNTIIRKNI